MKKRFLGALILVLLFLIPSPGIAGTRIDLFDVTVEVQRDGTMEVTERIEVTEEGGGSSGGVLRSFITGRPDTHGQIVDTEFTVLSAAVDGSEMPARAERAGRMVSVDLGRAGAPLSPGKHVYELVYRTKGLVSFDKKDYDYVLWDVTGDRWASPIERATLRLVVPDGKTIRNGIGFTGHRGEKGRDFERLPDGSFRTTRPLVPGEGFEVFAAWEKGIVLSLPARTAMVPEPEPEKEEQPLPPGEEDIHLFDVTATVESDGFVTVRERIEVTALGREIRRGIIRVFPTDYTGSDGRMVRTGFELLSATLDGETVQSAVERTSKDLEIRLGSSGVMLEAGRHVYEITYRTRGWIAFREDFDEFYWNVTGNDWIFPIHRAVYRVVLPEGGAVTKWEAFTGRRGGTGKDFSRLPDGSFETTAIMKPGEGFTVAVAWEKGLVAPPSVPLMERIKGWVSDHRGPVMGCLAGLFLLYYAGAWLFKGRDPKKGLVIPLYEPPEGVEPGYVKYLRDEEYSAGVLAADMLQLAVKGAIRFTGRGDELSVVATDKPRDRMDFTETLRRLCDSLTNWGRDNGMRLLDESSGERLYSADSSLRESYRARAAGHFSENQEWTYGGFLLFIPMALATLWLDSPVADFLGEGGAMYTSFIFLLPSGFLWIGATEAMTILRGRKIWSKQFALSTGIASFFLGVLGGAAMVILSRWDMALAAGFSAAALIAAFFGSFMPSMTKEGARLATQIDGLAMYIGTAERHRLSMINPPEETPELFEKLLPYAFALGLARTWADSFSSVLAKAHYIPEWSDSIEQVAFISMFGDRLSQNLGASVESYAPPSSDTSSYSGGSGFGGGGFSGGGGGGGGGRGW